MSEAGEIRERIDREVYALVEEIKACAHCAALRSQIGELMGLRMPDPIAVEREQLSAFMQAKANSEAAR